MKRSRIQYENGYLFDPEKMTIDQVTDYEKLCLWRLLNLRHQYINSKCDSYIAQCINDFIAENTEIFAKYPHFKCYG